jgi:hypothetical protein
LLWKAREIERLRELGKESVFPIASKENDDTKVPPFAGEAYTLLLYAITGYRRCVGWYMCTGGHQPYCQWFQEGISLGDVALGEGGSL